MAAHPDAAAAVQRFHALAGGQRDALCEHLVGLGGQDAGGAPPASAGQAQVERDRLALRESFLTNGGSATEFEKAWPRLHLQLIEQQATSGAQQSEAEHRQGVHRLWRG